MYNISMKHIRIEWDENKNIINKKKHKVGFDEAKTVFYDPAALIIHDPDHSKDEERFLIMGLSQTLKVLVVCHCYRENDEIIRIISARKADKDETRKYGG